MPNAPGVENGTRENFIASGSETFDGDQFDVRMDHRVDSNSNLFGRFTLANFLRDGPTAFGQGGGPSFVSLGGVSDVGNKSLAIGYDRSISSTLLADFRFGWFHYNVAVLPFDFGTRPAEAAGIPGLNLDDTFTSGLPALFVGRASAASRPARASASTAATARSIRTSRSGRWWATSPRSGATTRSSSASTCGAPTTCACPATRIGRAS